ncbi:MAG: hypothetical protein IJ678_06275 [Kiritimatiellae bacterium]|nr:hypothetical protein [Kiritimatiellia bacterium]
MEILAAETFFSAFSAMRAGAFAGFAAAVATAGVRIRRAGRGVFETGRFSGIGIGFPFLAALCLTACLAGPHCFLDSYVYRIPQMQFWLQKGRPWSVPFVDMRINQMPHVWPMLSAAFHLPLGEWALALPNYFGFLFLLALFRRWAAAAAGPGPKADAISLAFASAPVFVLGASTNDNVACSVAFLALSLHFAAKSRPERNDVVLSAVAFALCCGTKPQYLVLAPVWACWFFFAPTRPWKKISPLCAAAVFPVLLLCSPLPTMGVNQMEWGSYAHPKVDVAEWVAPESETRPGNSGAGTDRLDCDGREKPGDPPAENASGKPEPSFARSSLLFAVQMLTPPVNPFFAKCNKLLAPLSIRLRPVLITEDASLGTFATLLLLAGFAACRNRVSRTGALAGTAVVAMMCVAIAVMKPSSLGRSYIGFPVLLFPIAFAGLSKFPGKTVAAFSFVCLAGAAFGVATDASRPLLPFKTMAKFLEDRPGPAAKLAEFNSFSERHLAPLRMGIPGDARKIGLVVEDLVPIAGFWQAAPDAEMVPFPPNATAADFDAASVEWIVVRNDAVQNGEGSLANFLSATGAEIVSRTDWTYYVSKGPQPWLLLKRELGNL